MPDDGEYRHPVQVSCESRIDQYPDDQDEAQDEHGVCYYPTDLEVPGQFDRVVLDLEIAVLQ